MDVDHEKKAKLWKDIQEARFERKQKQLEKSEKDE